jgi:pimeloyl-ACP methyl ester carboxylesterase
MANSSQNIFSNLTNQFECWRLVAEPSDRSSFLDVAQLVKDKIARFPSSSVAVLMGESFGGLLALYVASTAIDKRDGDLNCLLLSSPR